MRNVDRNQKILELFNSGKTLKEIGCEFGITKQRVDMIVKSLGAEGRWQKTRNEYKDIAEQIASFSGSIDEFAVKKNIKDIRRIRYAAYNFKIAPPRTSGYKKRRADADDVIERWKRGEHSIRSLCQCDEKFALFVRRRIRERGIITSIRSRNTGLIFESEPAK